AVESGRGGEGDEADRRGDGGWDGDIHGAHARGNSGPVLPVAPPRTGAFEGGSNARGHDTEDEEPHVSGTMLEISLKNCHDAGDLTGMERFLSNTPGVQSVHLDRTRAVAHVTIDPQATNAAALHEALRRAGYGCVCQDAAVETP